MTDQERVEVAQKRILACGHAVQTGVAMDHAQGSQDGSPKHLRVGVNSALIETSSLAALMMAKGVFTEVEYFEALADAWEREHKSYEKRLSEKTGTKVKLA